MNYFIYKQNLRAALDSIYDAKVPPLWQKVNYFITSLSINSIIHRYRGTPQLLVSGLLSYWRGMLSSTAGVSRVDPKYSG